MHNKFRLILVSGVIVENNIYPNLKYPFNNDSKLYTGIELGTLGVFTRANAP